MVTYRWLTAIACFWILLISILSCNEGSNPKNIEEKEAEVSTNTFHTEFNHAKRLTVSYEKGYALITLNKPWTGAGIAFKYALVDKGSALPEVEEDVAIIEVPVDRLVATSTTHLPALEYLNELAILVGFPNTDYISSPAIRRRVNENKVMELGKENGLNIERLIEVAPDLVMDFATGNDYDNYQLIKKMGIPVVVNADYMEETPLGRAEWIKFMGLLTKKEAEADSVFQFVENNYQRLKELAATAKSFPTVFSGIVYGDVWYLPGGRNFGATFLLDANAAYMWKNNTSNGHVELSFESVYDVANESDYWIGVGGANSLDELVGMDPRYKDFDAFKSGEVYNYNARIGEGGGNEFLELGYLRPDIILEDLIKILHPELLPDHELYFYKNLK